MLGGQEGARPKDEAQPLLLEGLTQYGVPNYLYL